MRQFHLPFDFVLSHVQKPTWSDIDLALTNGWLDEGAVLEIAAQKIADDRNPSHAEVALSAMEPFETDAIREQVQALAKAESAEDCLRSKRRWLYLVLRWVYENDATLSDPLAEVEEIYSDFGYPEEIAGFVRYMPTKDGYRPQDHTKKANTERLMQLWSEYLKRGPEGKAP